MVRGRPWSVRGRPFYKKREANVTKLLRLPLGFQLGGHNQKPRGKRNQVATFASRFSTRGTKSKT